MELQVGFLKQNVLELGSLAKPLRILTCFRSEVN